MGDLDTELDRAPYSGYSYWYEGWTGCATDSEDRDLPAYEDLIGACISRFVFPHLSFELDFRGNIPTDGQYDGYYYFDLNYNDYMLYLFHAATGWDWEIDAGNASFYDDGAIAYEDAVSAGMHMLAGDQIRFEMDVAGTIPSSLGNWGPWYSWKIDVDNDPSTRQDLDGSDVNVVVRWEYDLGQVQQFL